MQPLSDDIDRQLDAAVIAIGAIFPGRGDTTGFWRDIVEGVDTFSDVPDTHWLVDDYFDADPAAADRTYGRRGAFLSPTAFDPLAFGVPPDSLASTDTAQLLALVAARQVLEAVEHDGRIDRARTSVVLGVASATELTAHMAGRLHKPAWVKGMREAGLPEHEVQRIAERIAENFTPWRESTFPGLLGNVIAGRIANRLDLGGCNYVTDAACASSLSALQIALHELRSGDSDMVLTGGVDALNDILMFMCFSKTPALSPTGDCRALSNDADGTMLGEGIGMLALRRLGDAERDGNRIHAVIRGLGAGSDGRATAIYAPLPSGQARTLQRAYDKAGYTPDTVELVEAHGTGTVAGDKAEIDGLHAVFGSRPASSMPWCALGSIKSQIGHTKAAAGSASLLKVIGALSRKILPPTIKISQPAAALDEQSPFYLNATARPWIRGSAHPRRASVSSFGFGGSNFHATLEEYAGACAVQPVRVLAAELILFSAADRASLIEQARAVSASVVHEDDLARVANDTHASFDRLQPWRAAIVASSPGHAGKQVERLILSLQQDKRPQGASGLGVHVRHGEPTGGDLAFLFAGQGSQYPGMGADLAMAFADARSVWDQACDNPALNGLALHELAFPTTAWTSTAQEQSISGLNALRHAQPAIAAVALAQLALLRRAGVSAGMCAGHSFGEIMALHYAGVFDEACALGVAATRGRVMADATTSTRGAMLAVQAPVDVVRQLMADMPPGLVIANDNSPGQVVLSGEVELVQKARVRCAEHGFHTRDLPVATAFHSPIVAAAAAPFAAQLQRLSLQAPNRAVYANCTATPYPSDQASIRALMARQIVEPVLFRQIIESMHTGGARTFVEIGPGDVLSGLVRSTLGGAGVTVVALDRKVENGCTRFLSAIGELAVIGVEMDVAALFTGMPAAAKRPDRAAFAVDIVGSNYQKPYPPRAGSVVHAASGGAPLVAAPRMAAPRNPASGQASNGRHGEKAGAQPETSSNVQSAVTTERSVSMSSVANGQSDATTDRSATVSSEPTERMTDSVRSGQSSVQSSGQPLVPSTDRVLMLREVSALHSQYLANLSAAHEHYLHLMAGLVGHATELPVAAVSLSAPEAVARLASATTSEPSPAHQSGVRPSADSEVTVAPTDPTTLVNGASKPPQTVQAAETPQGSSTVSMPPPPDGATSPVLDEHPRQTATGEGKVANPASISTDLVRDMIAEKTGYPAEMIEDDMDLGGELGIDSIKQVEILSALRTRVPELKELDTDQLTQLRTIRKIADFFT